MTCRVLVALLTFLFAMPVWALGPGTQREMVTSAIKQIDKK
jgi:hypothetical protein